jgi:hypothetical protein
MLAMQTWWNRPNATRIEIMVGVILIGLRVYLTYKRSKDVRRPARVRRMERNIAIALWSFIALAILVLFLLGRFRM